MSKVFVAMSGGVDSSVAAALLKKAGYEVSGVFMRFWADSRLSRENPCCSLAAKTRAMAVAKKLKIPFYVFDFTKEFKKAVVDYFLAQTKAGVTPNPCVICNEEIKFGLFLKKALAMGADFVATGHYARIIARHEASSHRMSKSQRDLASYALAPPAPRLTRGTMLAGLRKSPVSLTPRFTLFRGKDREKDQSYFLWGLSQKQLSRVMFPVGGYTKSEVRELAKKFSLPTAKTKDSQNLCFLASGVGDFLKFNLKPKPGPICCGVKKIIGRHPGLGFFTIGQRQGLAPYLEAKFQAKGPYFVAKKDLKKNILYITKNQKDLLSKKFIAVNVNWISGASPKFPFKAKVKIRSSQKEVPAVVSKGRKGNEIRVRFLRPERAITPGQSAVFYKGEELLGGGIINESRFC